MGTTDVIHTLRKLAREIHRRSVWQVLGVYALLGLPLWTPGMAAVLLLIGLPIVIATAAVQGGLPGLRMVDLMDPNELEGLTPDEVLVVPHLHPLHGLRLFTWRNAILGGVMAGALLVTSVTAYLAMWALGIGPVGSLLAQGILSEQDAIVVADFEDDGSGAYGAEIRDAVQSNLALSSIVTVLDRTTIADALRRMGRDPDVALHSAVARELAEREAAALVVDGGIVREAAGYHVYARILLPDGTQLARFQQSMEDLAQWRPAVTVLCDRLRERFGESPRAIRTGRDAGS
jgi:hypothetical protein